MIRRLIIKMFILGLTLSTLSTMVEKQYANIELCYKIADVLKENIQENEDYIKKFLQTTIKDMKINFNYFTDLYIKNETIVK